MNLAVSPRNYKKPYSVSIRQGFDRPTTISIDLISSSIDPEYLNSAFACVAKLLIGNDEPLDYDVNAFMPERVIISEPATIVMWSDSSKTISKAKDGDEYDPLFGIMACALRKVGKNRVSIDMWEPVIGFLADNLADAEECRLVADMLNATADALDLKGVMEDIEEYDARNAEPATTVSDRISEMSRIIGEDIEKLDQRLNEFERTRQTIRNLVDRGEL